MWRWDSLSVMRVVSVDVKRSKRARIARALGLRLGVGWVWLITLWKRHLLSNHMRMQNYFILPSDYSFPWHVLFNSNQADIIAIQYFLVYLWLVFPNENASSLKAKSLFALMILCPLYLEQCFELTRISK